MSIWGWWK